MVIDMDLGDSSVVQLASVVMLLSSLRIALDHLVEEQVGPGPTRRRTRHRRYGVQRIGFIQADVNGLREQILWLLSNEHGMLF